MVLTKCDQCRGMYAERTPPGEPPCATCRVDLMPENRQTAEVYMITRNQVIAVGMGQVIDINIPAVKIVMDLWHVFDQKKCLAKILSAFHHFNKAEEEKKP